MEPKIMLTLLEDKQLLSVGRDCLVEGEKDGGKYIGSGSFGSVGVICLKDEIQSVDCKHIMKAIDLSLVSIGEAINEGKGAKLASDNGVGPKFIKAFECSTSKGNFYFIISERYDMTIGEFLEEYESEESIKSLKESLLLLMSTCISNGFYHSDLCTDIPGDRDQSGVNEGNIMLKVTDGGIVKDAKLIDFDNCSISFNKEHTKLIKESWCCLWKYLIDDYESFKEYTLDIKEIEEMCGYDYIRKR